MATRRTSGPTAELAALRNLGAVSAAWLEAAGIRSAAELRRLGAVEAFRRVAFHRSGDVSLNLLYALEGAIRGLRWDRLPPEDRAALRRAAGERRGLRDWADGIARGAGPLVWGVSVPRSASSVQRVGGRGRAPER